ncbi:MAG TPA: Xaa-Pro peptidase family protein [Thermoleophilaceae bacterium]
MSVSLTTRSDRLIDLVAARELDSLLITDLVNVRYLTGFSGTNGACVVTPDERLFLTDFRYVEQAAEQVRGYETVQVGADLHAALAGRLRGRAGFDDANVTVRTHAKLTERLGEGAELIAAGGLVEQLRAIKDAGEVAAMRAAAAVADEVYAHLRERGLAGRSERAIAQEIESELKARGAQGTSFPSIVAAGAHGALPHAEPRDVEIPDGTLVVIDMGARVDGYCSDCTRTFATGELDDHAQEIYALVLAAQETALAAVRPGIGCRELDGVARAAIEDAGHGDQFGHGLGHGVGLEIHESPRISKSAPEGELVEVGNAITIEPGVYVPDVLGVRIEDLVIVGEQDNDVLTSFPKELVVSG